MKKGRYQQAWSSLRQLRFHDLQAARDMYSIHAAIVEERKLVRADSFFARFKELWTIPRVRRGTIASGTVMLAQQMCGINIIGEWRALFARAPVPGPLPLPYPASGLLLTIRAFFHRSSILLVSRHRSCRGSCCPLTLLPPQLLGLRPRGLLQ